MTIPTPHATSGAAEAGAAGEAPLPVAVLAVLLLASSLTVMAGAVLSPVVAVLRDEFALSGTQAGLVLTLHALSLAIASPLTGALVDRHGTRGPLTLGLLLYGLAGGAGALTTSYPALLGTRIAFGIGAAAVFTATTVALLQLATGPRQEQVMGWRGTATSLGGVLWPLTGGLAAGLAWQAPFTVYLLGVPLAVATWLLLPAGPLRVGRHAPITQEPFTGARREAYSGPGPDLAAAGTVTLLRARLGILGHCLLLAHGTVLLYLLLVFLPLRLAELGTITTLAPAALTSLMSLAMSLSGLAFARLSTRAGLYRLLPAAYGAAAASLALLALADHLVLTAAACALFGAGSGLTVPALTLLLARAAPPALHGRVTALSGTAIFLGQFVSPLLLGPLIDTTSTTTGFAAAAAVTALLALALLALVPRRSVMSGGRSAAR